MDKHHGLCLLLLVGSAAAFAGGFAEVLGL